MIEIEAGRNAVRFVHFYRSPEFPDFRSDLERMEKSGRCVWWRKGDKVIVSDRSFEDGVTITARRPQDKAYLFFDGCYLEPQRCQ